MSTTEQAVPPQDPKPVTDWMDFQGLTIASVDMFNRGSTIVFYFRRNAIAVASIVDAQDGDEGEKELELWQDPSLDQLIKNFGRYGVGELAIWTKERIDQAAEAIREEQAAEHRENEMRRLEALISSYPDEARKILEIKLDQHTAARVALLEEGVSALQKAAAHLADLSGKSE